MDLVLQQNYETKMQKKHVAAIVLYALSLLIIISWMGLCTFDEFKLLGSKGINPDTVAQLPRGVKIFYKGFPNVSTLLCYIMLTLAAFMTLGQRNRLLQFINITSFAIIVWLLFLLS